MMTVGTIAVHEFVTLDGVIEAPSWTFDFSYDPKMGEAIGAIMGSSKAILLGRRTYQEFALAWSTRTAEDDPGAPFMNETPKYVVSATLPTADWNNSMILGSYTPATIRNLKDQIDGNIYVSGSGTLVRAMLADSLVDELHLFVFRWHMALVSGCSPTAARQSGSPSPGRRPTATGSCTSPTGPPPPPAGSDRRTAKMQLAPPGQARRIDHGHLERHLLILAGPPVPMARWPARSSFTDLRRERPDLRERHGEPPFRHALDMITYG
jgi:dihydrofolate reductase